MEEWGVQVSWEGDNVSENDLRKLFTSDILQLTMKDFDPTNGTRSAFVKLRSQQDAIDAQSSTDGNVVNGSVIDVAVQRHIISQPELPITNFQLDVNKTPKRDNSRNSFNRPNQPPYPMRDVPYIPPNPQPPVRPVQFTNPILVIRNLDPSTSMRSIEEQLSRFHPYNINITQDQRAKDGTLVATMKFSNVSLAQRAQQTAHNSFLRGNTLIAYLEEDQIPVQSIDRSYLIIRNINYLITQRTLWLIFLPFNPRNCEVKYNQQTRQNDGHIQFYYEEDASEASYRLNGKMIQGQKIEIDFQRVTNSSQLPIQQRPRPPFASIYPPRSNEDERSLYVTNINPRTTQQDLELVFTGFNVARCQLHPNISSNQPSSAEVYFQSAQDAHQAFIHSKDIKIDNNKPKFQFNRKIQQFQPQLTHNNPTIIVRNLNQDTSIQNINSILNKYNPLNTTIQPDPQSLDGSLMATVEFSSQDIAILASKFANGQYLKGNLISSEISTVPQVNKWVTPQDGNSLKINNNAAQPLVDNKVLFVNDLSPLTTNQSLKQHFIQFNPISTSIPPNQPPNQQIHGFVNFSNEYDAQNALQSLRRSEIDGRRVKIIFKKLSNNRNNRSRINKKTLGNKIDEKQPQDVEQDDQSSSNSEDDNIIPVQVPQIQHQFVFPSLPEQLIIPPSVYKQMIIPVPQPIPKPEPEPEPELDNRFTINEQLDIGQIKDVTGLDQDAAINLYQRFGKNAQFAINFHLDHTF